MTKYLKLRSNRIIIKCILGIIILSLILTTINSYSNQNFEKYVAIVNGEKISLNTFQNMYLIEKEKQKKILGKKFFALNKNKQFIQATYNYVLSQLINNILLEQYASKINLDINDNKVKKMILNSSLFEKNQKFNEAKYFDYLTSINLTHHEYINLIKKKLNTEYFINTITNSNFVLDEEKENLIKLLSQKRRIKKAILDPISFVNKQKISDSESYDYFYKNKNNFYIPEQFKVEFVQIKLNDFKTQCNDQEITQWYEKNIKQYSTKEQHRYSIIQVKEKNHALSILHRLDNNEDFSKIAKEESIDPISSKNGGDIGWIYVDLMSEEIKKANLNQNNQISNIIPFHDQFLIIKLNEIKKSEQKKLSEVYNKIKQEIETKKSIDLYDKIQKKISSDLDKNNKQFNIILKENNLTSQETDWFDKNSIPKKLNFPKLRKIIFNKKIQSYPHFIILNNNQSFFINIKDVKNKKMQTFKDVKNIIIEKLKLMKSINETKTLSKKIISELKTGRTNLFKKFNLSFDNPESISRYDSNSMTSTVFSLPHPKDGKKIYFLHKDKNKKFFIVLLDKIYNEKFSQKEKNVVHEYLEKNFIEMIFDAILKNLHEKSIIKYENIEII
ncbi:MAG: SurA N-terminal domain-containing protein [Buchnera aphidicola (Diuraphis noxia)]